MMSPLQTVLGAMLLGSVLSSGYSPCRQRFAQDFRADNTDCRTFRVCSFGRLTTFTCSAGSVFDERTRSCVPRNSFLDRCTSRMAAKERCPVGVRGLVAHPTHCAQYYECGVERSNRRQGWEAGLRECTYPYVFSVTDKKCVKPSPGICGVRQEPLDQCDYKQHQCEVNAHCVPCHVRFPTCRGRQDGLNAWTGRQSSPYYVTCRQQRVVATGVCPQDRATVVFDEIKGTCVSKENGQNQVLAGGFIPGQQTGSYRPQHQQNQGYIPQSYIQPGNVGHQQTNNQLTSYPNNRPNGASLNGYIPRIPVQAPIFSHPLRQPNQNHFQQNLNQYNFPPPNTA